MMRCFIITTKDEFIGDDETRKELGIPRKVECEIVDDGRQKCLPALVNNKKED